jgi:hypothetical protein
MVKYSKSVSLHLACNIKKNLDMQIKITNFIMYDKTNISVFYTMQL